MPKTTIEQLAEFGQSLWLDNISRGLIGSGRLKEMISLGLRGVTSNPTIFDKAISQSNEYDPKIARLFSEGKTAFEIYDELTITDIQEAADMFKPVYERTKGLDGYVSLEVNPGLASLSAETIQEAKRLHKKLNRANVMLKIPATAEGFIAIEELISQGININATLIFSLEQYTKTAEAFIRGLKRVSSTTGNVSRIHSAASIFVSRIDTVVDALLEDLSGKENNSGLRSQLEALKGKAATANSALIYQSSREIFSRDEFRLLNKYGANIQRPLWASTGTKNPAYSNIKYIEELIAKDTVNTAPENTLEAFLVKGEVKEALSDDIKGAQDILARLERFGINVDEICQKLLKDGIILFENSFDSLLKSIENKIR
ncbi:MAG: transaldolase [Omnitrophica WOR_2 bacterium RIFOXYB2_FULL_45_11]|nr:MAG: transaldolase [Omnitrophica WOR_2 bacterium RIFOXYB2_FULL_45_11]